MNLTKKISIKNIVAFLVILAGLLIQLFVNNTLAGQGRILAQIEKEIQKVQRENQAIKEEMAEAQSLRILALKAQDLGLSTPEKIIYVDLSTSIASILQ